MKFDAVVGNPPYQGNNHQQIYPYFYLTSIKLGNYVSLIFPTGWQEPKDANNLSKMNNKEVKYDAQIVFIDNRQNVFPGITGAEWTNIILWQKGYNNSLDGKQKMLKNGEFFEYKKLFIDKSEVKKENEIERLKEIIMNENISSFVSSITSSLKPYGLRTDYFDRPEYYKLKAPNETKISETDITIYGLKNRRRTIKYVDINYPLPKKTSAFSKFKIFIGKAWGGPAESYVGGSFSDIILARPYDICTENYIESGCFDNITIARKHAKYLMTKFTRALLYSNKISHDNSKDKWISVPLQDYSEDWWELSIDEINERLYEKYNIPQDIRDYIDNHIQPRSEENIVNF